MNFQLIDFCDLPVPDTFTPVEFDPTLDTIYPTMLVLKQQRLDYQSAMGYADGYAYWYAIAYAQYHGDRRKHEMVPAFVK